MPPHGGRLAALLLLLAALALLSGASADDYSGLPRSGEWIVTDKQVVDGMTKVWYGNITVKSGGDLAITNSVFIFNSTNVTHMGILVEDGGRISMAGVRLMAVNRSEGWVFEANGSVEIRNCRFEGIFAKTRVLTWIGGFIVRSDNPLVEDSVFHYARGYGLRFLGCDGVTFRGNTVVQLVTGILLEDSSGVIENCVFYNNTDRQIVIRDCDGVQFRNNTVNLSGMGGLIITRSKDIETSGNIYNGAFYVVYVSNRSKVIMANEFIAGDQVQIESREDSEVELVDSMLNLSRVRALEGGKVELLRTVRILVTKGGDPVPEAMVRILDSEKLLVAEGSTDQGGLFEVVLPEATVTQPLAGESKSVVTEYGEYRFRALKGIYSSSGTADVTVNPNIELSMGLPWLFIGGGAVLVIIIVLIVIAPPGGGKRKTVKRAARERKK